MKIECIPNAEKKACINCGWKKPSHIDGWPHRICPQSPDLQPAAKRLGVTMADVGHYAQAVARWTDAGFPVRDQIEVEHIERTICKPCVKYTNGRCDECRCRVTTSSFALVNKIKMKTESCPLGKW